jgi:hypothetical protein
MLDFLDGNNVFYKKLEDWYGKEALDNKQINVLYVDKEDEEVYAVVYITKEREDIEISRVFTIGNRMEISIDLQTRVLTLGGIKKLIQYGGNFKKFEIED